MRRSTTITAAAGVVAAAALAFGSTTLAQAESTRPAASGTGSASVHHDGGLRTRSGRAVSTVETTGSGRHGSRGGQDPSGVGQP